MTYKNISYSEIGRRIRETREAHRLTQGQLGERLKRPVTSTAISLYERGEREVAVDVLTEIAELLGVSLEYLIKGNAATPAKEEVIKVALRADEDLKNDPQAVQQVEDFIEFMKRRAKERSL